VDNFRSNNANKRGNNQTLLTFKEDLQSNSTESLNLDDLECALVKLEELDSNQADIVTLKYFGGLTNKEIADVQAISERTVYRNWSVARLWLYRELQVYK